MCVNQKTEMQSSQTKNETDFFRFEWPSSSLFLSRRRQTNEYKVCYSATVQGEHTTLLEGKCVGERERRGK